MIDESLPTWLLRLQAVFRSHRPRSLRLQNTVVFPINEGPPTGSYRSSPCGFSHEDTRLYLFLCLLRQNTLETTHLYGIDATQFVRDYDIVYQLLSP